MEDQIRIPKYSMFAIPYLPLGNYELDTDVLNMVPKKIAEKFSVIAVDSFRGCITVATSRPSLELVQNLERLMKSKVYLFRSTQEEINEALKMYDGLPKLEVQDFAWKG